MAVLKGTNIAAIGGKLIKTTKYDTAVGFVHTVKTAQNVLREPRGRYSKYFPCYTFFY